MSAPKSFGPKPPTARVSGRKIPICGNPMDIYFFTSQKWLNFNFIAQNSEPKVTFRKFEKFRV